MRGAILRPESNPVRDAPTRLARIRTPSGGTPQPAANVRTDLIHPQSGERHSLRDCHACDYRAPCMQHVLAGRPGFALPACDQALATPLPASFRGETGRILEWFATHRRGAAGECADALRISRSAVTNAHVRLSGAGYVTRVEPSRGRRSAVYAYTDPGATV